MEPTVIYENKDFIVLAKPAGLPVHAGGSVKKVPMSPAPRRSCDIADPRFCNSGLAGNKIGSETLVDWLVKNYPEIKKVGDEPAIRPGIVHRLDKETSGVMVVARNQESFSGLKRLFQTRQVAKKYLALVKGQVAKKRGIIELPVGILKSHGVKRTIHARHAKAMKEAVTEFRVLERFSDATLVEAVPKTGRMHQIRVHFASIGHPVLGDRLYGGKVPGRSRLQRQFLHARSLSFSYPEGRRFTFEASLPDDLKAFLKELRGRK